MTGMKAEALHGLPVVSIADGTVVGHVDTVFFEPRERRIALLEISAAGQRARIPFATVHHIGADAVTIPDSTVVHWLNPTSIPAEQAGLLRLEAVAKLRVLDEGGTFLGTVSSVEVDPEDGRISAVQSHHGGVLGLGGTTHTIVGEQLRSASADLLVVAVADEPTPDRPPRATDAGGGERRLTP